MQSIKTNDPLGLTLTVIAAILAVWALIKGFILGWTGTGELIGAVLVPAVIAGVLIKVAEGRRNRDL